VSEHDGGADVARPLRVSDWRTRAACRGADKSVFFPGPGESHEPARRYCAACVVFDACYQHALHHEKYGIWAGTSEHHRRKERERLGIVLNEEVVA
jgi:hypothetical protein